jgi:ComF family protein
MILDFILDMVYPPRCVFCDDVIPIGKPKWFCERCLPKIISSYSSVKKIGEPDAECYCVFTYDDIIGTAIKRGKYGGRPDYFRGFAKLMAEFYEKNIKSEVDFIAPVPLHKKREAARGFNQAVILSKELSKLIGITCATDLLKRVKYTVPQSSLPNSEQREENVKNAFCFNKKYEIISKKIMLADDIYTTGNTIKACSKILKENGASEVWGFCIATPRGPSPTLQK